MKKTINFILFGDTSKFYELSKQRALELELVYPDAKIYLFNESDFESEVFHYATKYSQGYGRWLWKPQLILKVMDLVRIDDIVVYLDSRTKIPKNKINILNNFIIDNKTDCLFYYTPLPERNWTSSVLFKKLNININSLPAVSGQIAGGFLVLRRNFKTYELIKNWYELLLDTIHLEDRTNDEIENPYFKMHKHDQSCLSLLIKSSKSNITIGFLDKEEIYNSNSFIPHYHKSPTNFSDTYTYKIIPKEFRKPLKWIYLRSSFLRDLFKRFP